MTQKFSPLVSPPLPATARPRIRELGYSPGKFAPGPKNSILDVPGNLTSSFSLSVIIFCGDVRFAEMLIRPSQVYKSAKSPSMKVPISILE